MLLALQEDDREEQHPSPEPSRKPAGWHWWCAPWIRNSSYVPLQGYLAPAPGGVDAMYAWTHPGANGQAVSICEVEGGWTLIHEDLTAAQHSAGAHFSSTNSPNVMGVLDGRRWAARPDS